MGLSSPHEKDANPRLWRPFFNNPDKAIFYFNPGADAGTLDGRDAFNYCGNVLKQPPQTPVFFAIDFDPYDLQDPVNPPALRDANNQPILDAQGNPTPPPPAGWPARPAKPVRENNIRTYFSNIKAQRRPIRLADRPLLPDRRLLRGRYPQFAVQAGGCEHVLAIELDGPQRQQAPALAVVSRESLAVSGQQILLRDGRPRGTIGR